ncbi:type VI secretion system baseplate subunit TssE [Acinetobacter variabilis]|uniref:Type VI secretion system baseplate subunit TssE n=1 Tax=Acinetobacter variabilis TaxID=70346 RepID=A0A7T7WL48_9GAMM|nr:type VI secretion system baseplate subunit TssE [Acinetobacter variabilis]QQN89474.1 type VI secretion system baseplate subunit TssE [Acinetobacter variabilis]
MNLDQLYPYGFRSTLFERLLPVDDQYTAQGLSIQELRQSIAHDLEDLLNNRMTRLNQTEEHYPGIKNSILQFGIIDFVGLSTANPTDRDKICRSIEQSISAHEPRLKQVKVEMLINENNMSSLYLSISAYLNISPLYEVVMFDALLKPTTQQYVILARK